LAKYRKEIGHGSNRSDMAQKKGRLNILLFERPFPDKEPDSLSDMMQKKRPAQYFTL
jgi:hypothetical protein